MNSWSFRNKFAVSGKLIMPVCKLALPKSLLPTLYNLPIDLSGCFHHFITHPRRNSQHLWSCYLALCRHHPTIPSLGTRLLAGTALGLQSFTISMRPANTLAQSSTLVIQETNQPIAPDTLFEWGGQIFESRAGHRSRLLILQWNLSFIGRWNSGCNQMDVLRKLPDNSSSSKLSTRKTLPARYVLTIRTEDDKASATP